MKKQMQKPIKKQQFSQELHQQRQLKSSSYIPGEKNGKWSEDEHMKYIVYIDFFKEKMRSREKKRSNEFYKQMSDFIGTRNGLQCRSHHQKLEQKYVYTSKIVAAYKEKFDIERYRQQLGRLSKFKASRQFDKSNVKDQDYPLISAKSTKDAQIQTDLQGINFNYILTDPTTIFVYPSVSGVPFNTGTLFYPSSLAFDQHNMFNFTQTSSIRREQ